MLESFSLGVNSLRAIAAQKHKTNTIVMSSNIVDFVLVFLKISVSFQ